VLGAVLAFLAVGAAATSYWIVERQTALRRASRYNLTWLLSQTTNETLRMMEAASAAALPGAGPTWEDVELRLDLLDNRAKLLGEGAAREFLAEREEFGALARSLDAAIGEARALVPKLPDPAAAARLRGAFEPLVPGLIQLASLSNIRTGDLVARDQDELSRLHWSLSALLFAIMGCAAALVGLIFWMRGRLIQALTRARDEAQAANVAKSQFLANMSHELRTPLNGILGAVELLSLARLPEPAAEYVRIVGQSGTLLLDLISSVLDFARIEAGQLALDDEPYSPRDVVAEFSAIAGVLAREKSLGMSVSVAPDVPGAVRGDPVRVRQILMNLMGNAVKFTPSGRVSLGADVAAGPDGAERLRFEVRDTGIGISAAALPNIFERFVQADATNTRRFGGTGLGLTITRDLVEAMGGRVGGESAPGEGSRFWVELPIRRAEAARAEPAPGPAAPAPMDGAALDVLPAVGCESVAELAHAHVSRFAAEQTGGRVWLESVEVGEHGANSAIHAVDPPPP
jgi:signal transduction histidine kinase